MYGDEWSVETVKKLLPILLMVGVLLALVLYGRGEPGFGKVCRHTGIVQMEKSPPEKIQRALCLFSNLGRVETVGQACLESSGHGPGLIPLPFFLTARQDQPQNHHQCRHCYEKQDVIEHWACHTKHPPFSESSAVLRPPSLSP